MVAGPGRHRGLGDGWAGHRGWVGVGVPVQHGEKFERKTRSLVGPADLPLDRL